MINMMKSIRNFFADTKLDYEKYTLCHSETCQQNTNTQIITYKGSNLEPSEQIVVPANENGSTRMDR